jgi:hypothetical protein
VAFRMVGSGTLAKQGLEQGGCMALSTCNSALGRERCPACALEICVTLEAEPKK